MNEKWAIIKGYQNYAISTHGRVRNLTTGKELKHNIGKKCNYLYVDLFKNGKRKRPSVHGLVARHFLGPRPNGHITHHKDLNKHNPRADNLEYITYSENNMGYNRKKRRGDKMQTIKMF